jgi:N utilization substance protein B
MSKGPHNKLRRQSRLSAVQALYQMDVASLTSKQVIMEFLNHRFGFEDEAGMVAADETYFEDIINGVVERQDEIDNIIAENLSKNWTIKRLDLTLRAILRAGSYEILRRPDVPALVIIDQYVSITSEFHEDNQTGFVNRVLENMAKSARQAEFGISGV